MDETYDVVVLGTGLKECILSGILSSEGKKVLHVDRNGYYGGESASLNLTNLFEKFRNTSDTPTALGANRDWNVDLVPKFVMACGKLVKILIKTKVTRYLEWVVVDGSFVYQFQKAMFGNMFGGDKHIHRVPASDIEALKSNLMGPLEKNRCKNFFQYLAQFKIDDPSTYKSFDPMKTTMQEVYDHYGLCDTTIEYLGHCVALNPNEDYFNKPCGDTLEKMVVYIYSVAKYGSSPYIYPLYGLGGLPEGFSRLAAVHGGTYMLNTPVHSFSFDSEGNIDGVIAGEDKTKIKTKAVFCDPTYMESKNIKSKHDVIRCVCILDEAPKQIGDRNSAMVIIPSGQANRKTDIYITIISSVHGVCAKGKYVACIATICETSKPESEIKIALDLLPQINESFVQITPFLVPEKGLQEKGIFCSSSYDESSHFESATQEVLNLYKQYTGVELDLDITADPEDLKEDGY
eukprot:GHVH01010823.1.p1 GENE.GHVH01010823.1~~GHVH01010823.1.p1  ORF type:complete len:487 (-),score=62.04 GHVH01010823.1:35-1417(-)